MKKLSAENTDESEPITSKMMFVAAATEMRDILSERDFECKRCCKLQCILVRGARPK